MSTSLTRPFGVPNHRIVTPVERLQLAREIRQDLLSVRPKDKTVSQLRKDLQQGKNKAPDTLATILCAASNHGDPLAERLTGTVRGFFSARIQKLRRKLRDLLPLETAEEGAMNNTEMRFAQGDRSRPTLIELKREVCKLRELLDEMEEAIDMELFGPGPTGERAL